MRQSTFNKLILGALDDEQTAQRVGDFLYNIVRTAIDDAMTIEVRFIDGKSEPGRQVEKTEKVNAIHWLAKYIPEIEGRLLGVQADASKARNRSTETRDMMMGVAARVYEISNPDKYPLIMERTD